MSASDTPDPEPLPDLLPAHAAARPLWVRTLCVAGALVAFALGVVGWLVPVITGLPFYLVGIVLLASASDRVRAAINRTERRLPLRWRTSLRQGVRRLPSWWRSHMGHGP